MGQGTRGQSEDRRVEGKESGQTPQFPRGFLWRAPGAAGGRSEDGWPPGGAVRVPPGPDTGLGCRQGLISVASGPPGASVSTKTDCGVVD